MSDFFTEYVDEVLARLSARAKKSGDEELLLSKDQMLAVYQIAATLTAAHETEELKKAIVLSQMR